jgi:hypothetical protein
VSVWRDKEKETIKERKKEIKKDCERERVG